MVNIPGRVILPRGIMSPSGGIRYTGEIPNIAYVYGPKSSR
jgi:hypothetical protein